MKDHTKTALPVEAELLGEKASALGSAGERLEAALAAIAALDVEIAALPSAAAPGAAFGGRDLDERERGARELVERRAALRHYASEQLWYLIVQREAMGLRVHDEVYRFYKIPPELRVYAGPRRAR